MTTTNDHWVKVQEKTFRKWLNTKLQAREAPVAEDLQKDLSDGVLLIHLLEILGDESIGRYAARPTMYVQKTENVNKALDYIRNRGIRLDNIVAEDIVDGNLKLILGLLWTLILQFTINNINEEGLTAKEGLLLWCQRKTARYAEVQILDFSTSWNDGLAFCALLDIHRPDLIDYNTLGKTDHKRNMALAFKIATEEIGIPGLIDVDDVCDVNRPDDKSLMTYIAYWFHAFSHPDKMENAGRLVEKFLGHIQGAWNMQHTFEARMEKLLSQIGDMMVIWAKAALEGTYKDAKEQASQLMHYKRTSKRAWMAEKAELVSLLGNIKTKLATYGLRDYYPPDQLNLRTLEEQWNALLVAEKRRSTLINQKIRDIKENFRRSFADDANSFAQTLSMVNLDISELGGDLTLQRDRVRDLTRTVLQLEDMLGRIEHLSNACEEANVEENDHTVYAYDELEYEFGLVKSSIAKKLSFLENEIVARNMTNLTPIQLEEFDSVFRYFDKDVCNSLQEIEFSAALASLGLVYNEDAMHETFLEVSSGGQSVSFEQFIQFMVDVTKDQNSADQVYQSFKEVADGKSYITEVDLRHSLIPEHMVDELIKTMPIDGGKLVGEDKQLGGYDYLAYMEIATGLPASEWPSEMNM